MDNTAGSQPPRPALFWDNDGPTCTPGKPALCAGVDMRSPAAKRLLCCPDSDSHPSAEARIAESDGNTECCWSKSG